MAKMYFRRFRGSRNQTDFGGKKRRRKIYEKSSDSSDEDFVLDEEEEDDGNESITEDEVNDSDEEEEAESTDSEDSDEDSIIATSRKISKSRSKNTRGQGRRGTSKKKPRNQSTKRVEISSSDDEDFDPNYMSSTTDDEELVDDDSEGDEEIAKSRPKRRQRRKPRSSRTQKPRKRKKAPVSKKSSKPKKLGPARNQRETGRVSQRSTKSTVDEGCESDEDFVIFRKQPVKRQRKSFQSAETGRRTSRKRKLYNTSYSDSSCSDSDYIISEDDELSYRPHRLNIVRHSRNRQEKKYTCSHNSVFNKDEEASRKKGKEKIDKSQTLMHLGLAKPVCGICLSDEGKAVRGKLDCCDHYFCFVCIMEWAKVESRCPMCKQRFSVISKLSKSGKGLRGTSVKIPVRDQVYQPSEEEIMGFLDPYANIVCLECNEAGDDGLLLLCDLCDSPHHTYCVGLGRVVPEGDWYCQACQTSMPTQSNTEEEDVDNFVLDLHDEDDGLTIRELVDGILVDVVGAERINLDLTLSPPIGSATVRETRPNNVRTIRRRMVRRSTPNPSPRLSDTPRASVRQTQLFGSPSQVSSSGARTLSGQRRLQQRIHALRDNWSAQERASEQFSPDNFAGSNSCIGDRNDVIVRSTFNNRSRLFYESTRRGNLDSSKRIENASGNDDIDRAWSLMEESRALAGGNIGTNERLTSGRYCGGSSSANTKDNVSDSMHNARPRSILGTSSCDAQTRTRNWQGGLDPATVNFRGHSGRSMEETSHREIGNSMPSTASVLNRRFCPIVSERSESPNKRLSNPVSSGFQLGESKIRKVEGAKDQVRTMVKACVKNIIAGKEIDKPVFKEIARSCTHTILAACGIDHSNHMVQPFERVSCYHTNQVQSSELMPGCCAHCFDIFVKDLTGNMVRQKLGINV